MHRTRSCAPGTAFTVTLTIALVSLAGCTSSSSGSTGSPATLAPSTTSSSLTTSTTTTAASTTTSTTTTAASTTTSTSTTSTSTTTTVLRRPVGPVADLSEELTGGTAFIGSALPTALESAGYVQHEYVAAGTATSYRPEGSLSPDGHWTFTPDGSADYRTRVLIRRPEHAADFSGTVVIEWLNVSGGIDADPEFASLREDIVRNGDVWVGVSAQLLGVEGGPVLVSAGGANGVAGKGLRAIDPARYGTLSHPGDGFSFDIFTQVARAVRAGGPAFGDLQPASVIAAGESQSAFALTTYIDGVQPLTHAFDGFFIHSRAAVALPLVQPGEFADLAHALGTGTALLRDDTDVPIMELQAESDVTGLLASVAVRQPDTDHFRLWEVAGTAHADAHLLGPVSTTMDCGVAINNGPMHVVAKAAYRALVTWIRGGTAPPSAPRLELTDATPPALHRDADGIALGGVRTPPVDVPVDVLSGDAGPKRSLICLLLGSTTPLPQQRLAELYPTAAAYTTTYAASVDAAIATGYVLPAERDALAAFADPSRIVG